MLECRCPAHRERHPLTTRLVTTARSDLRDGAGANTHFCFSPSVYGANGRPNPLVVQALIDLKIGFVRERWWPGNPAQQSAFATLAKAGVGFYLFIGAVGSTTPPEATKEAAALAASPIAANVVAVCGPNEPNAAGRPNWASEVVDIQQAIYTEVSQDRELKAAGIVGPALKHNVANIDGDYLALKRAGVGRWCDAGDFHYYPGAAGPVGNAAEAERAGEAYGALSMWHSETGWTGADTDALTAARFSVEALLRNHLSALVGTILYETADESQYVPGREGLFGLRKPVDPKPAYTDVQTLLATRDGGERFGGSLAPYSQGVESDCDAVVTSEGAGRWTVYLLSGSQPKAFLVLPAGFSADVGTWVGGDNGSRRYTVALAETMTTVHVKPLRAA